ncbi:MAG: PAS domain S-box protein [Stigonema ocellatum SAG 48.90 = DSM 106950]|nr:PAS domain S-box protein [Stigonema ocellatum SAG 48.90 = DSM 106950]
MNDCTSLKDSSLHQHPQQQNFSLAFLLRMINGISDPIFVKNRQHQLILFNDAFCNFIRHSREELIGKSDYDLFPKAEADVFREKDELVFTTGITDENEEYFTDSYGVTHFILTKKCLFEDELGHHFLVGTIHDFTQQKRVEAELAEKASLAALHVEINTAITQGRTLQPILKHCTDALVNHVNAAFARIWTLNTQDNVLELQASSGMYTHINGPHGRVPVGMFKIGLIAQERQPHLTNNVLDDPRVGNQEWAKREGMVAFAGYPLILDGNLIGVIAMFARQTLTQSALDALQLAANEISVGIKRIQAELALKESEKKYRHLVEASQNMIWSVDAQGYWTFVNQAVRSIYGYEPAEMIGRHCHEFEPPEQIQQPGILPPILAGESVFQYEAVVLAKDGRKLNLLCNAMVLRDEAGNVLGKIGTATNITELKRAEAALRRSNAVLQAQQEASIDGILIINENRQIASYNQHFSHLWQIPSALLQTDDQQLLGCVLDQLENPGEFLAKVEYLYQYPEENSRDEIVLRDGRTFDRYSAPVRSPAGDCYGRIWYFRDITQRKQALSDLRQQAQELETALHKLKHTQTQLIQSEKMSSLGQLVAGVAHEINNPVNFIYGNLNPANEYTQDLLSLLDLYRKHYPQPGAAIEEFADIIELEFLRSDLPKLFKSMMIGAERIRDIVLSLRSFSRLDEAEMKAVDIHEGIDSTLMIIQSRLKSTDQRPKIEVIKEYGNLPLVECYAGQLNQVFMNILVNAIDALEESLVRGRWATKKQLKTDNPRIYIRTQLAAPNEVTIRIADNGLGIPEDIKSQLFNPFFTTKPIGKGTGMGLAISYQIITERHSGSIECISQPGVGAEFVIRIPLIQERGEISRDIMLG